ncbi:MAG: dihydrofolate reductase family protein [Halomonas sp.]|nr:dihydrofolate reductase family protein [Halomonas sp.]
MGGVAEDFAVLQKNFPQRGLIVIRNPAEEISELKKTTGPDLLVQGSSSLLQTLLDRGLVDQFTMLIYPVVLGGGKRLFGEGVPSRALSLVSSKVSSSGVTINTYMQAGEVQAGSFGL